MRTALAALVALALGLGAGWLMWGQGDERQRFSLRADLPSVPAEPARIEVITLTISDGTVSTHFHTGPTVNLVLGGRAEISERGRSTVYGPGEVFWEPARRVHTLRVLDELELYVFRVLPRGEPATVQVER